MSALLLEPAGAPGPARSNVCERDPRGGPTLDDLITGVWEGLAVHSLAGCPACGGAMSRHASGPGTLAGVCEDCSSELT